MGIDRDVPTRDVLVWETLDAMVSNWFSREKSYQVSRVATQPKYLIDLIDSTVITHSGPSSVCRQSRDSGTILSRAIFISVSGRRKRCYWGCRLGQEESSAYLFLHLEVTGTFTEFEERNDYHTRIIVLIDSQSSGGVLARKHPEYIFIKSRLPNIHEKEEHANLIPPNWASREEHRKTDLDLNISEAFLDLRSNLICDKVASLRPLR